MHQTKEKLKHRIATVLQCLLTLQHLRWGRRATRRRSGVREASLWPGEAGGGPSGGAGGFGDVRGCRDCSADLGGFLLGQKKSRQGVK